MTRPATGRARLLFVVGSAHPLGGLMTWLDYLLPGLEARGWSPVLGLVEGPRYHRPERLLATHPNNRWIRIACRTGTSEGRARALVGAISEVRPAVAVGVNVPDLYPALARARRVGSRSRGLMTVHGIEPDLYADAARFRLVLDGAAGTNRLACVLLERDAGFAPERVFYTPYGVETPAPGPSGRDHEDPRLRVGFAGRLEQPQKRVLDLPLVSAALERLGVPCHWRVAGAGPEEAALRSGLPPDQAELLGTVASSDLPARLYRQIDALLVTSSWETGPLVAWEAMAEGVPVVASRYLGSGLESALRHEENALLFDVGDVEEAARQLARLARDRPLAARLREGGFALVRERYARTRSIEGWDRALAALLELPLLPHAENPAVPPATGRLERWFGPGRAETVRAALGRTGPDTGSGGEWPHAYGPGEARDAFFRRAAALDRPGKAGECWPR
ncbi:MAG TPA: glycosyltransferase family 4 protein [Gemmatimonadota bacterium]|nr:glycosyltransferase family 4 protein [Gemmatimonadota bacterium]